MNESNPLFNILSCPVVNDTRYYLYGYVVSSGESGYSPSSGGVYFSACNYLGLGHFRVCPFSRRSSVSPALSRHILHILCVSGEKEMAWSDAVAVVAGVRYFESVWNWADKYNIAKAMRSDFFSALSSLAEDSVSALRYRPCPNPTTGAFINLGSLQKPLLYSLCSDLVVSDKEQVLTSDCSALAARSLGNQCSSAAPAMAKAQGDIVGGICGKIVLHLKLILSGADLGLFAQRRGTFFAGVL